MLVRVLQVIGMLVDQEANELAAQLLLVRDARALAQPARSQDHQERDAQPADDRIHAADQLLKAHEGGRIPQRDNTHEDDAHTLCRPTRESAGCREEQREHRVVDERENDERVDKGEGRVNHARNLEGRHVDVPDAVHVQVEGEGIAANHQGDDSAADTPSAAGLPDA